MDKIETIVMTIPCWALCALINDDFTGLSDDDERQIRNWLENTRVQVTPPEDDEEIYFEPFPAFGLACDCIDCKCIVL